MNTKIVDVINESWAWIGLNAVECLESGPFGNVIVRARDGRFWRICPEELSCEVIAESTEKLSLLLADQEFQQDWQMAVLVDLAVRNLGVQPPDRCFCLKIPAVLGGPYESDNIGTISRSELLKFAGYLAEQIKDLPDGCQVELVVKP